jgi:hypothetical protein
MLLAEAQSYITKIAMSNDDFDARGRGSIEDDLIA